MSGEPLREITVLVASSCTVVRTGSVRASFSDQPSSTSTRRSLSKRELSLLMAPRPFSAGRRISSMPPG
jgi:hypothetical protein